MAETPSTSMLIEWLELKEMEATVVIGFPRLRKSVAPSDGGAGLLSTR